VAETTVGRHSNGDQPTGTLFIAPSDPRFRRAAGNRKGKSSGRSTDTVITSGAFEKPSLQPPLPSQQPPPRSQQQPLPRPALPAGSAAATALIPAQRPLPERRPVVAPLQPVARVGLPPVVRSAVLPLWTKVCVVLGTVLLLLGFGGLGAAYAMSQGDGSPGSSSPHSAGSTAVEP
jgi:hypothetical protein